MKPKLKKILDEINIETDENKLFELIYRLRLFLKKNKQLNFDFIHKNIKGNIAHKILVLILNPKWKKYKKKQKINNKK